MPANFIGAKHGCAFPYETAPTIISGIYKSPYCVWKKVKDNGRGCKTMLEKTIDVFIKEHGEELRKCTASLRYRGVKKMKTAPAPWDVVGDEFNNGELWMLEVSYKANRVDAFGNVKVKDGKVETYDMPYHLLAIILEENGKKHILYSNKVDYNIYRKKAEESEAERKRKEDYDRRNT